MLVGSDVNPFLRNLTVLDVGARRAAQQTPGTNNAYSGTQEPSANNSLSMQSPGFKNGGSFLGSDSKGGLRNQTSANASSLK